MHVMTVIGARPQFIKAAPVCFALRDAGVRETLVHTGQHYDEGMSDIFFRELGIPAPHVNLGVGSGSHGKQTAAMLEGIDALLLKERPDAVLVYGDTNSTLAGALAARKLDVPVAHIEAGLRSFNRSMPGQARSNSSAPRNVAQTASTFSFGTHTCRPKIWSRFSFSSKGSSLTATILRGGVAMWLARFDAWEARRRINKNATLRKGVAQGG